MARKITSVEKIEVKMTGDVWVGQTAHAIIDKDNGSFTLGIAYCMPPWTGYDVPNIYDVRVTGVFFNALNPLDIIKELFFHYAEYEWIDTFFNRPEIEAEIGALTATIGIVCNKTQDLFSAIEKLQNSSTRGFQLKSDGMVFTVRRDDNMREISKRIKAANILNLDEVEIENSADNYATECNVSYAYDQYNEQFSIVTNNDYKGTIMSIYHIEKPFNVETLLKNKEDALEKAKYLSDFYSKPRLLINGVMLWGEDMIDIRVYDIIEIDLTADVTLNDIENWENSLNRKTLVRAYENNTNERYTVSLQKQKLIRRKFGGVIKAKVMSIKVDLQNLTNTIDLLNVG